MLGKLIRHELKATGRVMLVFYIVLAGLVGAQALLSFLKIPFLQGMLIMLLIMAIVGVLLGTMVFMVIRYYKSMFGREGYLTQTLPVKKSSLLASRLLVSIIWLVLSALMCFLSLLSLYWLYSVDSSLPMLLNAIPYEAKALILFALFASCTQGLLSLCNLYFCITLSHTRLFLKNNILFSVVWYLVVSTVISTLELVAMLGIPLVLSFEGGHMALEWHFMVTDLTSLFTETNATFSSIGLGSIIFDIIGIGVLLPLTCWLLNRKTSVK